MAARACLVAKEVPYLVLMIVGALQPGAVGAAFDRSRDAGLRHERKRGSSVVSSAGLSADPAPDLTRCSRFRCPVVDVALIVGPYAIRRRSSVLAVRWFADADIRFYFPPRPAASLQLLIVVAAIAIWSVAERIAVRRRSPMDRARDACRMSSRRSRGSRVTLARRRACAARRDGDHRHGRLVVRRAVAFPLGAAGSLDDGELDAGIAGLAHPIATTLALASRATADRALVLVLDCLENEARTHHRAVSARCGCLYVPLPGSASRVLFGARGAARSGRLRRHARGASCGRI